VRHEKRRDLLPQLAIAAARVLDVGGTSTLIEDDRGIEDRRRYRRRGVLLDRAGQENP